MHMLSIIFLFVSLYTYKRKHHIFILIRLKGRQYKKIKIPTTNLAPCVYMSCGVTYGDSADNFSMIQGVDLPSMSWNSWTNQSIWWKGNRLHLSVSTDMEWVCTISEANTPSIKLFNNKCWELCFFIFIFRKLVALLIFFICLAKL